MWYSRGGCDVLEDRLQLLVNDGGAIDMLKVANTYIYVHLYLVHVILEAEVMLLLCAGVECQVEGEDDVGVEPDSDVDVGKEDDVGKEGDVEDDGGEDIGEHDGVEPDVEAIDGEEGDCGKSIDVGVVKEKECDDDGGDDDGGHVSEDYSWLREVEFVDGEVEVVEDG